MTKTQNVSSKILLKEVRLCFPDLAEPKTFDDGGAARYSCCLPIEPGSDAHKAILTAMKNVAVVKWENAGKEVFDELMRLEKTAYVLKPKVKKATREVQPGFEGMYTLTPHAQASSPPTLIDRDRTVLPRDTGKLYSGCYVNVSIEFWAQDHSKFGRRLNCSLLGVQFWNDGAAFGGSRPASADEFPTCEEGSDGAYFSADAFI